MKHECGLRSKGADELFGSCVDSESVNARAIFLVGQSSKFKTRVQRIVPDTPAEDVTMESVCGILQSRRRGVGMLSGSATEITSVLQVAEASRSPVSLLVNISSATGQQVADWMQHGCIGAWSDDMTDEQLKVQLDRALWMEGQRWLGWKCRFDQRQRLSGLNEKESRVLNLVVNGCHNKWIAEKLGISQRTVELRRHEIHEKTRTKNVAQLVRLVIEAGWDIGPSDFDCTSDSAILHE